ncbi:hypothetical protein DEO72_LG8g1817 [Vigna unguiculata]|uniref:Uncharacterized protein n=1 Tax=Vigna unguiculata TaxID=3917 RepID=A0A4D6MT34_VIGUN|nr:hypothetical protein DEO72_LG8g1817 [Vigna unguiculata]
MEAAQQCPVQRPNCGGGVNGVVSAQSSGVAGAGSGGEPGAHVFCIAEARRRH